MFFLKKKKKNSRSDGVGLGIEYIIIRYNQNLFWANKMIFKFYENKKYAFLTIRKDVVSDDNFCH